jgi:outer membrane lipoprotein-sorting protein
MKLKSLIIALFVMTSYVLQAQEVTVDEILDNYFENTGGREAWESLDGILIEASTNQGGMEIPLEIVQLSDGKTYTKIALQGQEFMQNVYNGEVLWGTNFQSMKAEKADQEAADNMALQANDFPDSFLNYKEKGYTVELMGKETVEGTETYKIKLVKEPKMVNGEEVEDITFYYFDTENYVPIVQESEIPEGPMAGKMSQTTMSDYQEVENGLYMPYSMTQGIKGVNSQTINIKSIKLNPEVEASAFDFPEE